MARQTARFRISVKDNASGSHFKVELIQTSGLWGERRFILRVNGRQPRRLRVASLTQVCDQLRRWLARRHP
jgi:hypothetical protein